VQQHQRWAGPESPRENLRAGDGYFECLAGGECIWGHCALNARRLALFR